VSPSAQVAGPRSFLGVALTTLATLMLQILITRIFSVTLWDHFAFMAVSIAMFGLTLGATIVYLRPDRFPLDGTRRQMAGCALAFAIATVVSFVAHLFVPLVTGTGTMQNGEGFVAETVAYLSITSAIIAVSFAFLGIVVCLALTRFPAQLPRGRPRGDRVAEQRAWDTAAPMEPTADIAGRLHRRWVHARRVRVLSGHFAPLLGPGARVLDVGAGDGRLAAQLARARPDLDVRCIDVAVRPTSAFRVETYDGRRIPFADRAFDAVLLVDVLHHVDDPLGLLAEARRVGSLVLLKDHALEGWLADPTLRFMDWVGNARYGIPLPFRYWPRSAWVEVFERLRLDVRSWRSALGIYPWPATLLFDRGLHFVAALQSADDRA